MRQQEHASPELGFLRVGAVCAIVGTLAYGVFGATHGDLEIPTTETALRFVAARPAWQAVHLLGVLAYLLWAGALVALAGSLTRRSAGALARLAQASLSIGTTVMAVDLSLDGIGLKALADAWASAPVSGQADLLRAGDLFIVVLGTTAWSAQLLVGLAFLLYGLTVLRSREYPVWLAWGGVVAGAGWLAVGIGLFLDAGFVQFDQVLIFQLLAALWMPGMGVLMWRRAGQPVAGQLLSVETTP